MRRGLGAAGIRVNAIAPGASRWAELMLLDNWKHRGVKQADNVRSTFAEIDWITIFFFIGLFVVVYAVEVSGVLRIAADKSRR